MKSTEATAQLTKDELERLVKLYDLERYLFEEVSARFRERHTLSPYDFFAIVVWKSNRAKTKVKEGLDGKEKSASDLMAEVYRAGTAQARVEALLQIWGIGLPIASAILTVCYPDEFTVLDLRAWKTLHDAAVADLPPRFPQKATEYLQYCQVCRSLAQENGLSLRDLDRALWAGNWENAFRAFIKGEGQ